MGQGPDTATQEAIIATKHSESNHKRCAHCKETKPLSEFLRRTGKRHGSGTRRGACRTCRMLKRKRNQSIAANPDSLASADPSAAPMPPKRRIKRPLPTPPPKPSGQNGPDASVLRPNRHGIVWMRGRTDKGRRWQQESDLETAVTLVREHAAVVVNRHTVRRLYSNRNFRQYILTRDQYTCFFCGDYGDTIDHLLPRAKGGHTTPLNCVCACNLCNQSKADRSVDEFIESAHDE
ncbi:HNH endonuclease [Paenibacillus abyssi]|uniref:HNH nuclease domain-containing protein n=2 Tax=Paenibacillus abyssi TaxID=1340531 RepID=A0A917CM69_9BACL|nr:hypothetical protein GCM10010916_07940 [Paenibacillus abyssi]